MTEKQKDLIDDMNEFCREKFKYTNETTVKEASEYISRNIEEFKLVTMSEWQTKYLQTGNVTMTCTKCGSQNVVVDVSVYMYIDPEDAHKLTKESIQKKSTTLVSASLDRAQILCRDCSYVHTG